MAWLASTHCVVMSFLWLAAGSESDVRDHRGMLGPWCRGPTVSWLCRGAHRTDLQDNKQYYLGLSSLHSDFSHQWRPTSQRIQYLRVRSPKHTSNSDFELLMLYPNSADLRERYCKQLECSCYFYLLFFIFFVPCFLWFCCCWEGLLIHPSAVGFNKKQE